MNKENVLEILNSCDNLTKKYTFSDAICDSYLVEKNINAVGYPVFEDNKNIGKIYPNYRYALIIELPDKNNNEILTSLLMNPSNTYPEHKESNKNKNARFDNTIRNLIILADKMNFSTVVVLNTFPLIEGSGKKAAKHYEDNKSNSQYALNREFIKRILRQKEYQNLLIACGDKVLSQLYKYYLNILKDENIKLWTYAEKLTCNGRPRHLSTQSNENRNLFNNSKKLYGLKLKNNNLELNHEIWECI